MPTAAKVKQVLALAMLAILLPACAWLPENERHIGIDSQSVIHNSRVSYLLSLENGAETQQMLLVLEQQLDSIKLVGLSNTGITLFVLERTEDGDTLEKTYFYNNRPDAKKLLDQLQWVYYSPTFTEQMLTDEWQITLSENARQWFYRGKIQGSAQFLVRDGEQYIELKDAENTVQLQVLTKESLN